MWSTLSEEPNRLIVSGFFVLNLMSSGAGYLVNSQTNWVVKTLTWVSPMSKTLELVLRTITSKSVA